MLAACDSELLGGVFREGDVVLRVSPGYYGGSLCEEADLKKLLQQADVVSLVGERSISVAVETGLAEWRFVKRVGGIPHLNIYRL